MAQHDTNTLKNTSNRNTVQNRSQSEQLAAAKKEIHDLKMKLLWMERNYE